MQDPYKRIVTLKVILSSLRDEKQTAKANESQLDGDEVKKQVAIRLQITLDGKIIALGEAIEILEAIRDVQECKERMGHLLLLDIESEVLAKKNLK